MKKSWDIIERFEKFDWEPFDRKIAKMAMERASKAQGYSIELSVFKVNPGFLGDTEGRLNSFSLEGRVYYDCVLVDRGMGSKEFFVRAHEWGHLVALTRIPEGKFVSLSRRYRSRPKKLEDRRLKWWMEKEAFDEAYLLMKEAKVPGWVLDQFLRYRILVMNTMLCFWVKGKSVKKENKKDKIEEFHGEMKPDE